MSVGAWKRIMEREPDTVVVYDGDCPFRSAVATALRRLPAAGTAGWDDGSVQASLEAQFGERPFGMFSVDAAEERVYAGRAARECGGARVAPGRRPGRLRAAQRRRALGRGPGARSRSYHDSYPLAEAPREQSPAPAENARDLGVDHLIEECATRYKDIF